MRGADLILIEGQLFPYLPPFAERLLIRLRYRLILEFDDAIYHTRFHQKKISNLLRISNGAIVGNGTLAEYARNYSNNVMVIPTVVDTVKFRFMSHKEPHAAIRIIWIGLSYNFHYLSMLSRVLLDLQRDYPLQVRVVSSHPPSLPGVNVEFRPWNLEEEVDMLQTSDIGVMPLHDDIWTRGKCGLKLLQYMAAGLPAVASPIGVNNEIIADGENGFLAASPDEWYAKLDCLCRNPKLRLKVGRAAVRTVEERYSLQVWAPRLIEHYRHVANGGLQPEYSQSLIAQVFK
jgi:glycosyltransferase involved in cell wall biosynthesis